MAPSEPVRAGVGTLLVVDDHEQILPLAARILRRRGYEVLTAGSPAAALALCDQHQRPIDALVTDITMPGMSGLELAERLRASRPDLRVLFMSGYGGDDVQHQGVYNSAFLQKPFTPESLAQAVQSVLATPGSA